jgi:hypothetical protein
MSTFEIRCRLGSAPLSGVTYKSQVLLSSRVTWYLNRPGFGEPLGEEHAALNGRLKVGVTACNKSHALKKRERDLLRSTSPRLEVEIHREGLQ